MIQFPESLPPTKTHSVSINDNYELDVILSSNFPEEILDEFHDRQIRYHLKGEDYTIELPNKEEYKNIISPVILTFNITSWRKEEGLINVPGFQRYRVKVNGRDLGVWYKEDENLLHESSFDLLTSEYPGRKFMIAIGIKEGKIPRFPENYKNMNPGK